MADEGQWSLKVKIVSLDTEAIDKKSKWVQGDTLTLQIEGHGTVGMAKQRIALLVGAHEKDLVEEMNFPEGTKLNDIIKLEEIPNFGNGSTLFVHVKMPTVVLSDDEGLRAGEEPEPPAMASPEVRSKELTEEEQDKQGALKQETAMQMVMDIIQANHDEVMAVMRETRDQVQRLEARLDAGRVPGPALQAASSASSSSAAAGSSVLGDRSTSAAFGLRVGPSGLEAGAACVGGRLQGPREGGRRRNEADRRERQLGAALERRGGSPGV